MPPDVVVAPVHRAVHLRTARGRGPGTGDLSPRRATTGYSPSGELTGCTSHAGVGEAQDDDNQDHDARDLGITPVEEGLVSWDTPHGCIEHERDISSV
jgi:hypothetical protein